MDDLREKPPTYNPHKSRSFRDTPTRNRAEVAAQVDRLLAEKRKPHQQMSDYHASEMANKRAAAEHLRKQGNHIAAAALQAEVMKHGIELHHLRSAAGRDYQPKVTQSPERVRKLINSYGKI